MKKYITGIFAVVLAVGASAFTHIQPKPAADPMLYWVAADPALHGKGLGARLLSAAEQAAREGGATSLRLEVKERNKTALALYAKSGYGIIGRIAQYYDDGSDARRLEKAL